MALSVAIRTPREVASTRSGAPPEVVGPPIVTPGTG